MCFLPKNEGLLYLSFLCLPCSYFLPLFDCPPLVCSLRLLSYLPRCFLSLLIHLILLFLSLEVFDGLNLYWTEEGSTLSILRPEFFE